VVNYQIVYKPKFWVVGVVRNTLIFKMYKGVDMGKIYKRNFQSSGWSTIR